MKHVNMKNALISMALAVTVGVLLLGVNAAFGVPTQGPPGSSIHPTFNGLTLCMGNPEDCGEGKYLKGTVDGVEWIPASDFADDDWIISGSKDAMYSSEKVTNVGIGTTSPSTAFHVKGSKNDFIAKFENDSTVEGHGGLLVDVQTGSQANNLLELVVDSNRTFTVDKYGDLKMGAAIVFMNNIASAYGVNAEFKTVKNGNAADLFVNLDSSSSAYVPRTVLSVLGASGNVGIDETNPAQELHIHDTGDPAIVFDTDGTNWYMGIDDSHDDQLKIGVGTSVGGNIKMAIGSNGEVGIGTAYPSAMLDVNGKLKANSIGAMSHLRDDWQEATSLRTTTSSKSCPSGSVATGCTMNSTTGRLLWGAYTYNNQTCTITARASRSGTYDFRAEVICLDTDG